MEPIDLKSTAPLLGTAEPARRGDGPAYFVSRRPVSPKVALVLVDMATVAVAIVAATALASWYNESVTDRPGELLALGLGSVPLWPLVFSGTRLYSIRFVTRVPDEVRRVVRSAAVGTVLLTFVASIVKVNVARSWVASVFVMVAVALALERSVARVVFSRIRTVGRLLRPVVVVGGNTEALEIAQMLEADRTLGYDVRAFVDVDLELEDHSPDAIVDDTMAAVRRHRCSGVIVAATAIDLGTSNLLIRELTDHGIHVELSSTLRDIASHRLTVRPLGRFPVVYVEPVQRHGWRVIAKRAFDICLAIGTLIVTSPMLLAAVLWVKLDEPGGRVLFRQVRVGRDGKLFNVLKLRTMVSNAEDLLIDLRESNEADGPLFKMADDPRVTRPGRVLRRLSIDELPQLLNVLRNEMSMVGPRPALPAEVAHWGDALHGRLRVKPGITGMWQVGGRSQASFADYERLDLYYVDNWSLTTDLVIVAKTIPAVLGSKGAC